MKENKKKVWGGTCIRWAIRLYTLNRSNADGASVATLESTHPSLVLHREQVNDSTESGFERHACPFVIEGLTGSSLFLYSFFFCKF